MPEASVDTLLRPSTGVSRETLAAEVAARRERLAAALARHQLDAVLLASEANAVYLTGYETTFWGNRSKPLAVIFAPPQRPLIVCHAGEAVSVKLDAFDVDVVPYTGPERLAVAGTTQLDYQLPAVAAIVATLAELGVTTVGLECSWHFIPGFTPLALAQLEEELGGGARDASAPVWEVRRRKSEWELEQMQIAAAAAELTHGSFAELARPGMSERELGRLLRRCAYDAGAERIGYSGIVAGVDRAPLGGPTDRHWEEGQLLFADICLQLNGGYFADFNRILASAPPSEAEQRAYRGVVEALDRGREVARAGTTVAELAAALIGDSPSIYARVGHGLGLEMPEPPSLSPADETPLLAGEVVCLEPNTWIEGVGWLVSEEEVVIEEDGCRLLSPPFPRELPLVD